MGSSLKNFMKCVTPPILWNSARSILTFLKLKPSGEFEEKDATWYDESFSLHDHYYHHYTRSPRYFLWAVIADRIMRDGIQSVLDIGCGPGQVAALLRDKGLKEYFGVDFSQRCIESARLVCPEFRFAIENAFETDLFQILHYDAVVCIEFLEHVERDIELLTRVRCGAKFYGSVPSFPWSAHVRWFRSCEEVSERYEPFFREFHVDPFFHNSEGRLFYVFEGVKS